MLRFLMYLLLSLGLLAVLQATAGAQLLAVDASAMIEPKLAERWMDTLRPRQEFPGTIVQSNGGVLVMRLVVMRIHPQGFDGKIHFDEFLAGNARYVHGGAFGVSASARSGNTVDLQIRSIDRQPQTNHWRLKDGNLGNVWRGRLTQGELAGSILADASVEAGRNRFSFTVGRNSTKVLQDPLARETPINKVWLRSLARPSSQESGVVGKWQAVTAERDGQRLAYGIDTVYNVRPNEILVENPSVGLGRLVFYPVDPATPDDVMVLANAGSEWTAARMRFEQSGDTLTICYGPPGTFRASRLSPPNSRNGNTLLVMKRIPDAPIAKDEPDASPMAHTDRLSRAVRQYVGSEYPHKRWKARELLVALAEKDDPLATMWVARCLATGRCGFPRRPDTANAWASTVLPAVQEMARRGNREAQFLVGSAAAEGLGMRVHTELAERYFTESAAQGHALAMAKLGYLALQRNDQSRAQHWFAKGAYAGDVDSMVQFAILITEGKSGAADKELAERYFREAANRGSAGGAFRLGVIHESRGEHADAFPFYLLAAAAGHVGAKHNVGVSFAQGRGVSANRQEAERWFKSAVADGFEKSQFALNDMSRGRRTNSSPAASFNTPARRGQAEYEMHQFLRDYELKLQRGTPY